MKKKLNRGWVKNATIVFLLVALLLTLFSNTIMNFSLPEVVTEQPRSGSIVNAIRGTANVETMGTYSVEVEHPRQILEVYVREGQEVSQGDPLFLLEEGEHELSAQLAELELNYQRMLIELGNSDFAMQNEGIRQAREDLQRAQNERAGLGNAEITETTAQLRADEADAAVAVANSRLAQLELELSYLDTFDSRSAYIGQLVIAYEQALANFLQNVGVAFDDYTGPPNQWSQAVDSAQTALEAGAAQARVTLTTESNAAAATLSSAEVAQTTAQNTLNRIQRINLADDAVRMAQRELNAALISLSSEQQSDNILHQQQLLELQALEGQIEDLEERIARQGGDTDGGDVTITAQYDGILLGLTAVAGQTAQPDIPLARIEVSGLGYTAELSVETRQATQVRPGAQVDVRSAGWFTDLSGHVAGIRVDPDDSANRRIITVEVTGDVTIGEQVELGIHLSQAMYDTIVPRSALGQDATGYHVYILHARDSPLGTRYTAVRVDVTVEAEDETHVAVRGDLERNVNVIIRSSDVLSDRQAVRLATD
ncbi:MAG: hypothetical protein FWE28_00360 [Oscillospiraceae bacterium]|nr:hypothetical protein [Oscillospiraceae bacterium]